MNNKMTKKHHLSEEIAISYNKADMPEQSHDHANENYEFSPLRNFFTDYLCTRLRQELDEFCKEHSREKNDG